jgi:prevent-host-death family protein
VETIGAVELIKHLSVLLDRVTQGEKITITRHGTPVALLSPVEHAESRTKPSHKDIIKGMRSLRAQIKPDTMSVRDMIEEGRRF